jgi:hypothetical protein
MDSVNTGLNILITLNLILLIIGLFKPWIVLWWEHTQYRLKVIKVYGMIIIGVYLLKMVLNLIF